MIRHENVRMNVAVLLHRGVEQALLIEFVVPWLEKDSLPVHAALNYVLRRIGNEISGLSGHYSIP